MLVTRNDFGKFENLLKCLDINEFQFHLIVSYMLFLPLCHDKCDYLTRCRSLCDIGILAPHLYEGLMSMWHNCCLRGITWCLCGIPNVFMTTCCRHCIFVSLMTWALVPQWCWNSKTQGWFRAQSDYKLSWEMLKWKI